MEKWIKDIPKSNRYDEYRLETVCIRHDKGTGKVKIFDYEDFPDGYFIGTAFSVEDAMGLAENWLNPMFYGMWDEFFNGASVKETLKIMQEWRIKSTNIKRKRLGG